MVDTLSIAQSLQAAGIKRKPSEAIAISLAGAIEEKIKLDNSLKSYALPIALYMVLLVVSIVLNYYAIA